MPSLVTFVAFAAASIMLLVIPGPAVVYIVTRSASQGRRAGLVSVAGIHSGTVVHIAAAVVGLSALLVASATAFTAVKMVGAGYLVWLGIRAIRSGLRTDPDGPSAMAPLAPRSLRRVYVDGAILNVFNPKTAVFFLSFVPQFVDPATPHPRTAVAVLGVVFIILGLISDGAYAVVGGSMGARLRRSPRLRRRTDFVAGGTYLGLGAVTAVSGSK